MDRIDKILVWAHGNFERQAIIAWVVMQVALALSYLFAIPIGNLEFGDQVGGLDIVLWTQGLLHAVFLYAVDRFLG